jgi:hypothetical protein
MKTKLAFLLLVLLGSAAVLPLAADAQTTYTFWAEEDSWVNEANPGANYGNATYLSVKDRSSSAESYLRFKDSDLSQLKGLDIAQASLLLYQYQDTYSPGDDINVHRLTGDWNEAQVTWDGRPSYEQQSASSLHLASGDLQWREWAGLKDCVASWAGGQNYGLALENGLDGKNEELFARFYSSEFSDQSLRPQLKVTTTPEPVGMTLFLLGGGLMSFIPGLRKKPATPNRNHRSGNAGSAA